MQEIIAARSEFEQLKEKVKQLRAAIGSLTAQRDELKFRECPRIQVEYDTRIGALELRVSEAQNRLLELKRAIEILQAARNRQEEKAGEEAERQAREEYQAYEDAWKKRAERLRRSRMYQEREAQQDREWQHHKDDFFRNESFQSDDSVQLDAPGGTDNSTGGPDHSTAEDKKRADESASESRNNPTDNPADSANKKQFRSRAEELRYYYHLLVKQLHPDVNPNQTPEEAELFRQAVDAFKSGDLDKLKDIYQSMEAVRAESSFHDTPEDVAKMQAIVSSLEQKRLHLVNEIEEIKSSYPYLLKAFLADENAVAKRQKELAEMLASLEKRYQELQIRFQNLKEGREPV